MKREPRFGVQPARKALRDERWSVPQAAAKIGVNHYHLMAAINGYVVPKPQVRIGLAGLLGKPVEALFTYEALQAKPRYLPERKRESV